MDLDTHLNLITDFTDSLSMMFSTMSYGRGLFLRRRIGGSLIFREKERGKVLKTQIEEYSKHFGGTRLIQIQQNGVLIRLLHAEVAGLLFPW